MANDGLRLRPAMTADLKIETGRATGVTRVPRAALRFQPTAAMFTALHQPVPAMPGPHPDVVTASAVSGRNGDSTTAAVVRAAGRPAPPPLEANTAAEIWVADDGRLEKVPVHLGLSDGTWTEIKGGVEPGQDVVTGVIVIGPK